MRPHSILISASVSGLLLLSLITFSFWYPYSGPDSPSCHSVYMSPIYAKVHAFDSSHTKFASKYSLYLYREQGKDQIPTEDDNFKLSGTPILFIPGNAGSFKQVRSIASKTSELYFDDNGTFNNLNKNNLDFFTADFNEDFTAFHGRTMLDQAEYLNDAIKFILSLYRYNKTPARSVILLGHSMGGMVARVMLSLPNYLEDSVNTIITLAAPHSAAPTTFDGDLLHVFTLTDEFWRNGFVNSNTQLSKIAHKRLNNISLISITGGTLDTTLPSDYTSLIGLVPSSNGFSISTTGIPGVWTPIDHLAIVWCDQLRQVLAKTLLEIVNKNSVNQTYSLIERMNTFKRNLLPNPANMSPKDSPYLLKIDLKQLKESSNERIFKLPRPTPKKPNNIPTMHLFYIPKDDLKFKFNYISSLKPSNIENLNQNSSPSILLCKTISNEILKSYKLVFDYTSNETNQFVELECLDFFDDFIKIPRSDKSTASTSESSLSGDKSPFYSIEINPDVLSNYNTVILAESLIDIDDGDFVLADLELEESNKLILGDSNIWKLITRGNDITIPSNRPIIVDIDVPSARSSLLAYKFDIRYKFSNDESFVPLMSQSINDETKWYTNINGDQILSSIIQGQSPYCPSNSNNYLKLKVFTDSLTSNQLIDIYMSIDWMNTFKLLVLRYRLSIIGFPIFITASILALQMIYFIKFNIFPSFGKGLLLFCDPQKFSLTLIFFSILSILTSKFYNFFRYLDPVDIGNLNLIHQIENNSEDYIINLTFMGINEPTLWFFGPIVLLISIALNVLLYNLIILLISISIRLSELNFWKSFNHNYFLFSSISSQRRTIGVLTLMMLVLIYLPYQFAFLVCTISQAFSTLKLFINYPSLNAYSIQSKKMKTDESSLSPSTSSSKLLLLDNFKNFNLTFLILMLWIVPINVPILIVWIHNLSLRWNTPFSSHHNILAVLPIVLMIQCNIQGFMLPKPNKKSTILLTKLIIGYFAFYSLIFGTRHLYLIHSLFNMICTWFLLLFLHDWGNNNLQKLDLSITKDENSNKLH